MPGMRKTRLSSYFLYYSLILYVIPFLTLSLITRLANDSTFLHDLVREAAWWMFFIPALILPFYYGMKGARAVAVFSVPVLFLFIFLYAGNRLNIALLIHGILATFSALFISLCIGLLSDSFSKSSHAVEEQNRQLKSLFKTSELVAYSLDPQDVLSQSLTLIREGLGFDYGEIWLLDDQKQNFLNKASNVPPIEGAPAMFSVDYCLPGLVLEKEEGMYIDNPLTDERVVDKTWVKYLQLSSEAMLPLIYHGEKLGVLIIANKEEYSFTEERKELLQTFSNQLALSIQNARLYSEMEQKAILDAATGLYNYRYFQETLEKEVKRVERDGGELSLLMMDLDYFKDYNDTFGHPAGDKMLREFSEVLKESVRETDICVRYGGDEFAVILPQTDVCGAQQLAERIFERISRHHFTGFERMPGGKLSISIGQATFPGQACNSVDLVKLADDELYKMKDLRRNIRRARA